MKFKRSAKVNNRCYGCRASEPRVTSKYGGEIVYRCTLIRDPDNCKKKIRTYKELFTAQTIVLNSIDSITKDTNHEINPR